MRSRGTPKRCHENFDRTRPTGGPGNRRADSERGQAVKASAPKPEPRGKATAIASAGVRVSRKRTPRRAERLPFLRLWQDLKRAGYGGEPCGFFHIRSRSRGLGADRRAWRAPSAERRSASVAGCGDVWILPNVFDEGHGINLNPRRRGQPASLE